MLAAFGTRTVDPHGVQDVNTGQPTAPSVGRDLVARALILLGLLLYAVLLQWMLVRVVEPYYAYLGYVTYSADYPLVVAGSLLAILPGFVLPVRLLRPSAFVVWMLVMIVHVPSVTVPFWTLPNPGRFLTYGMVHTAVFVVISLVPSSPSFRLPSVRMPVWARRTLLIGLTLLLTVLVLKAFGLRAPTVSFASVYQVRAEYKDQVAAAGRGAAYAVGWLGLVIVPLAVGIAVQRRSLLLVVLAVLGQIYLFGLTGYKSLFFGLVLSFAAGLVVGSRRLIGGWIPWLGLAMIGSAGLAFLLADFLLPVSVLVRRLLITPGLLTGAYFDFFETSEAILWSHSLLEGLVTYPLPEPYPKLISLMYLRGDEGSANVHFLADAYANLKAAGVFIVGIVAALMLWLADAAARNVAPAVGAAAIAVPCSALANSALNTSLLTHGILLSILLLFWLGHRKRGEC